MIHVVRGQQKRKKKEKEKKKESMGGGRQNFPFRAPISRSKLWNSPQKGLYFMESIISIAVTTEIELLK